MSGDPRITPATVTELRQVERRLLNRLSATDLSLAAINSALAVLGDVVVTKAKAADTTKNNNAIYAADPHLVDIVLKPNSAYVFLAVLDWNSAALGTNAKIQFVSTQADWTMMVASDLDTPNAIVYTNAGATLTVGTITLSAGNRQSQYLGRLVTVSALDFDLEWAQGTALPNNTTLLKGSSITLIKQNL
jgi:hypothetical protein